jgi:hypothetical protein
MFRTVGERKDPATPFQKYLNQEKVYVSPAFLGLVDTRIIGVMLQTDPMLTFRDDIKSSIMDIISDNTPIAVFSKRVRELKSANDNPRFTNALAIQVAIKDCKNNEAYTEKLAKTMEYLNEHGNHPVLSQCVFVPFGRGAAIHQNTFCNLIRMKNEFLHNIKHVEIHRLSDIEIEPHLGINDEDGKYYANSIREILLEECDIDRQRIFHSIERTTKADTSIDLFSKHNDILCNSILSDLDNWPKAMFEDANNNSAFRKSISIRVHTSTVDQRKSQTQVKYNAYASRIVKRLCSKSSMKPLSPSTLPPTAPLNGASI